MPAPRSASRSVSRTLVTRTLLSLGAVAGLGVTFVAGTSYGGSGGEPDRLPPAHHGSSAVTPTVTPAAYTGSGLSLPESCDQLLQWYVERGLDLVGPYGWGGHPMPYYDGTVVEDAVPMSAAAGQAVRSPLAPAPVRSTNGETGTNVQEAGVDEPDVVKTDGHTLYRVQDGDLVTYDVSGAQVQRLGSLQLPGATSGAELLLSGDTVVVLSQHSRSSGDVADVVTLDVSDPATPRVTHTVEYDTSLVTARLHDGVVRLVLSTGLPQLDFTHPDRTTTEYEALQANQQAVRDTGIEDWLPTASLDGAAPKPLLGCDQVALPAAGGLLGTVAVVGFDASAPDAPSVTGLAADTDLVYASADQLYLATSPVQPVLSGCIDCVDPGPMPMPMPESGRLLPGWLTGDRTPCCVRPPIAADGASHLYAFDLDGIDTTFAAAGQVDGAIRDRWSMDAVDGVLRVAVGPTQDTGNFNSIVTFRQEGNDLVEAGRLDKLGVGEGIESVRWFDTLAIVVTYRRVDPLYAIDLTDPASPRLMGTLKIPGFSAYLHPLGQHRLLGLGEGPTANLQPAAQAALFNVTDLTHPTQLDVLSYGPGTQALATQDPRQLTWLPDGRTVLTVIADYGNVGQTGYVSVLTIGDGTLANRMVPVEYGDDGADVRLVPLPDGRVVLVTGSDASFFAL